MAYSKLTVLIVVWTFSQNSAACLRGFVPKLAPSTNSTKSINESEATYDLSVGSPDYPKGQVISAVINTLLEASIDLGVLGGDKFLCPSIDTALYADPFDCTYYMKCDAGTALRVKCGEKLGFDNQTQTCVPLDIVPLCKQLVFDADYKCSFNGLHSYLKDCEKYYVCVNGKGFLTHCGEGNSFDSALRLCIPKSEAQCFPAPK